MVLLSFFLPSEVSIISFLGFVGIPPSIREIEILDKR
jgi:hypothetical protein